MYIKGSKNLVTSLGFALLLGTTGVAVAATSLGSQSADAQDAVPSLQQAAQLTGLQPTNLAVESNTTRMSFQSKSIIAGNWRLEVSYAYSARTGNGWQVSSYEARRVASSEVKPEPATSSQLHGYQPQSGTMLQSPVDGIGGIVSMPAPPPPEDPYGSGQTSVGTNCGYVAPNGEGPTLDIQTKWSWVPAHQDEDSGYVPGHWEKVYYLQYNEAFKVAPFCK